MRELEMKGWMGKCKRAWHYKLVSFWQVSLQRVAGGLFNISVNENQHRQSLQMIKR